MLRDLLNDCSGGFRFRRFQTGQQSGPFGLGQKLFALRSENLLFQPRKFVREFLHLRFITSQFFRLLGDEFRLLVHDLSQFPDDGKRISQGFHFLCNHGT